MSRIAIKPFIIDKTPNMGLEKYGQVVFEGVNHNIPIWAKEDVAGSGIERFITGLNEFAPELNKLEDEEKEAKIKQIREAVIFLEGALASNKLEIKDKNFWEKVKICRPDNVQFWKKIFITPSNDELFLDKDSPDDLIKIFAIEAGGFPEIAPSFEAAKKGHKKYKFFLDKHEDTVKETTKQGLLEGRAGSVLIQLFDENANKLKLVCKVLDPNSAQYKKNTPTEVMFGNMDAFIKGVTPGTMVKIPNSAGNPRRFLDTAELDMETLKLRAIVKDGSFYGILGFVSGKITETATGTVLGVNITEAVEYLKNAMNDDVLQRITKKVEGHWNT